MPSGGRSTYAYRSDGLRSTQDLGSGVQSLVWDVPGATGFGDLFEELDNSGNLIRAYYRATDLATQKDTSGSYAFHWMDTGTAQILTDLNQLTTQSYQFSAWGEQFQSTGNLTVPLSWNGQWGYYQDTSARTWVRARQLDVLRGRWLSQDPTGFGGGLRLYDYVDNRPPQWVDPTGLHIKVDRSNPKYAKYAEAVELQLKDLKSQLIARRGHISEYLVRTLEDSRYTVTITFETPLELIKEGTKPPMAPYTYVPKSHEKAAMTPGQGCGSYIVIDPTRFYEPFLTTRGYVLGISEIETSNQSRTPPTIALAHELAHAFHAALGTRKVKDLDEELAASRLENAIRAEFSMLSFGQRLSYYFQGAPQTVNPIPNEFKGYWYPKSKLFPRPKASR